VLNRIGKHSTPSLTPLWFIGFSMGYTIKSNTKNDVFGKNQLFHLDGFPLGAFDLGKC